MAAGRSKKEAKNAVAKALLDQVKDFNMNFLKLN